MTTKSLEYVYFEMPEMLLLRDFETPVKITSTQKTLVLEMIQMQINQLFMQNGTFCGGRLKLMVIKVEGWIFNQVYLSI